MKLWTSPSNWPDTLPDHPHYPQLAEPLVCDVLVIGGGMGGALMAYELVSRGMNVALVEKRSIAGGSSSANTGLIQCASDKSLTSCMHSFGAEAGLRFYTLSQEALRKLERVCTDLPLDTGFIRRESLYYASTEEDVPKLAEEYATLAKHGFPVRSLDREQVAEAYAFVKPAALIWEGDAEVNPFRLVHGLIAAAAAKGLRVYEQTEVRRSHEGEERAVFYTAGNQRIEAGHAVFATGYETQEIKANAQAILESSYAIATQPLADYPGWPGQCLIWETARPYLYLRTTVDGRIVAGGLDEATWDTAERDAHLPAKTEQLLAEVRRLFPGLPELRAEYSWAAAFGSTRDGLPLIGPQEGFPRSFFLMGYGGNGTVYSLFGAEIIADLIEKGAHPDAHLFRIDRPQRTMKQA